MLTKKRMFLLISPIPYIAHLLFHLADWFSWGVGINWFNFIIILLWPFYGEHAFWGFVSHAVTEGWTLILLIILLYREWKR